MNNPATALDTSSAPAATSTVVGTAATTFAAPIAEPILAKSPAAASIIAGVVITKDIVSTSYRTLGKA
ncbi:hypothetical protein LAUMK22_02302 [Mycobacterium kansasii]|uniref:Uncharacterized protein n=1 Tax=Mycobacterium kansasii TaxID=1768 RepID=A0A1V3XDT6_MYCKA|nr:hypothetical protein MKSMC1_61050 [Mycobacterium kansasii]OOK77383.1 hypothetical protein BZL29_3406 [Mycobacterium kansasii]VAZ60495.1 hypothetical protein LAUMK22_02302 [Mycobacterium kansasii]VAZ69749.1 hypothetical protein LAUMK40_05912 [Mycobacterium kansasii]